ncbi:peptide deformylase [Chloroflexota bacterium]
MSIRPIFFLPEPVLRQKAKKVPSVDDSIQRLIDDMLETLRHANGVGLAAPQIGVSLRVAVIQIPGDEDVICLINPKIVKRAGEREVTEGCLSIPGYSGEIKRSEAVTIKAWNRNGKEIRIKGTELLGQALEHELDHLNGVLYIDHLESQDKLHSFTPEPAVENR